MKILYYIFLILGTTLFSQEPAFEIIGSAELDGISIYSINQDSSSNIWLATSSSLIKYDGQNFKTYSCKESKSNSLFNLVINQKNEIFCFNLRKQIFKLNHDSLSLFFTFPDSLMQSDLRIKPKDDSLIVYGKRAFILDSKGKIIRFIKADHQLRIEENVYYQCIDNDSLYFKANSYELVKSYGTYLERTPLHQNDSFKLIPSHHLYLTSNLKKIFSTRKGGAYVFNALNELSYRKNRIYKDFYISNFLEDYQGNYWFTTLGKGILFVSNPDITSLKNFPELINESITASCFGDSSSLYIGTESGAIFRISSDLSISKLDYDNNEKITILQYNHKYHILATSSMGKPTLFKNDITISQSNWQQSSGAIKDFYFLNDSIFYTAHSKGWSQFSWNPGLSPNLVHHKSDNRNIGILVKDNLVHTAGINGYKLFDQDSPSEPIKHYPDFQVSDFESYQDKLIVSTNNKGIFIYENQSIIDSVSTLNGLSSNKIKKIKLDKHNLYIVSEKGIDVYELQTRNITSINHFNGLISSNFKSFDVKLGQLALVTSNDIQTFNLSDLKEKTTAPKIDLIEVINQDSIVHFIKKNSTYTYDQNSFGFKFQAKVFNHQNEVSYCYRLNNGENQKFTTTPFHQNSVQYPELKPGVYSFEVYAKIGDKISSEIKKYNFEILPPFWLRTWFLSLLIMVIILVLIIFYQFQIKKIKKKNQQKQELSASKLTAIKSQMNPHFIFNSLNSIQDLILKQDVDNSYNYIVKFSNLVRRTLNYSDKEFIDIEDEINLLKIYLDLEKLRFKSDFNFNLLDNGISGISIPPMLIQPYIENAIKHGLLHVDGNKVLTIHFELKSELICTIEDNGIGMKASKEIQDRQNKVHESFSTKANAHRFEILKEHYKGDFGVTFHDLQPGTKVVLKIPFNRSF